MKVLQINSFFSVGGPPRIMNGIYDTLKENGIECKIAAAREKMYVPEDSYQVGTNASVYMNALIARIFDNEGMLAKRATRKLVKFIKDYNPDIIHLHNLHGYCFNVQMLFQCLKEINKPVIWTLHDCWTMTGHCAHFALIGCNKWKTGCHSCPQKKEYPSSLLFDRSKKNYADKLKAFSGVNNLTIVTPANWLASFISESILKEYPVKVIHNGIDLEAFSPIKTNILEQYRLIGKKIILGVAQNWAEKKGLEDFIELSKLLSSEYQVVLIGLTEEQKYSLPKTVLGLTKTRNVQELVEWYSVAQVFVNFTYQDTFPTVNIEALACGTPILTYKTGGSPEALDSSCGWVVEQGDIEGALKIIYGMKERKLYTELAIARALNFSRRQKYVEYVDLYNKVLNKED